MSLTCSTQPKYKVKAVSFHANDETGIDLAGSDEPYWVFCGVGLEGTQHCSASQVFGDIDTGDTASFGSTCRPAMAGRRSNASITRSRTAAA